MAGIYLREAQGSRDEDGWSELERHVFAFHVANAYRSVRRTRTLEEARAKLRKMMEAGEL